MTRFDKKVVIFFLICLFIVRYNFFQPPSFLDFHVLPNLVNNDIGNNYYQTDSQQKNCSNKTKIMFSKNVKVAGSTISAILLQIATHYHKYEIMTKKNVHSYLKRNGGKPGYSLTHFKLKISQLKHIFPKRDCWWISTTRNVYDQVNSMIKFYKLQNHYNPSNFHKTLKLFQKRTKSKILTPFTNGGTPIILLECRKFSDDFIFKSCAEKIANEFDLIIPTDRIDEGLIMLHKFTCLPLSDFAYTK